MAVTMPRNAGMLVLGLYLIVVAFMSLSLAPVPGAVPAVLALVAGVLILIGR